MGKIDKSKIQRFINTSVGDEDCQKDTPKMAQELKGKTNPIKLEQREESVEQPVMALALEGR